MNRRIDIYFQDPNALHYTGTFSLAQAFTPGARETKLFLQASFRRLSEKEPRSGEMFIARGRVH